MLEEKNLTIKHIMDSKERKMSLDEAFLEVLYLSEGEACEVERKENAILKLITDYPETIHHFSTEYKKAVLSGWEYEIIES